MKEKIQSLERSLSESSLDELESFKAQLQDIRDKKVEGMIMRSRVKWLKDGEQVSKYFCNLEKRNFVDKSMSFLAKEDGNTNFLFVLFLFSHRRASILSYLY